MKKDKLTQEDIDALISQMQGISPYNLKSRKKFNKGQFILLENLHKRFLRNIEASLTNLLDISVITNITDITELSYNEFFKSTSTPTCLYLLNVSPSSGKFTIEIDPNFAFFVINKVLGGSTNPNTSINRELSLIEKKIMYRVLNLLLRDLEDAWKIVACLKLEIEGFYSQSDYFHIIGRDEKIILISVELRGEETKIGFLNLCLPISVLETFIPKAKQNESSYGLNRTPQELSHDRELITYQISQSIVPLKIILGEAKIKVDDLLQMEVGDIICLDTKINKPLDIFAGNLKLYKGWPVKEEKFLSIKIVEATREEI